MAFLTIDKKTGIATVDKYSDLQPFYDMVLGVVAVQIIKYKINIRKIVFNQKVNYLLRRYVLNKAKHLGLNVQIVFK